MVNNPDYDELLDCETSEKLTIFSSKKWQKTKGNQIIAKGTILKIYKKEDDKVKDGILHSCIEIYDEISERTYIKYYELITTDSVTTMCLHNGYYIGGESRYIWSKIAE